ncbi:alpha/beta hydrolase family protein [Janthinobacterium lividum]|uniref:Prolyl oligopeptidase family serine peptidase n=1 Tax=Janthinobacterium lividum TaxID=29581 RepID=A0ABU0XT11_9BURK|nr:prolyl oligopeptidase family serine peptidase [Janthinobacterium lividum]MDQ4626659.1 prolyl oligopeptidase family serine peptidase [Janthinobacterium lividum]MDQ4674374.1 prolyl oligopeptidase family serine peptidase [Janthinobacterium lividum]MDQ4685105.1 prolyl oligopeptidase family serine peptidase [Janthinobacterium lividum]
MTPSNITLAHRAALARAAMACLLLAIVSPQALAQTAAASTKAIVPSGIGAAAFFDEDQISSVTLSPDGNAVAILLMGDTRRRRLAVLDVVSQSAKVVASFSDLDIANVEWVNAKRLVFDTRDSQVADGQRKYAPGMFAVDRDGSNYRQLASMDDIPDDPRFASRKLPSSVYLLDQFGTQDSDVIHVLKAVVLKERNENTAKVGQFDLLRLNTTTQQWEKVAPPAKGVLHWLLDQHGKPRLATVVEGRRKTFYYLEQDEQRWRAIASQDVYDNEPHAITPLEFGPDGTLYVSSRNGADTRALYAYDLAAGRVTGKPLVTLAGYDFDGGILTDQKRLLGVYYTNDATTTEWFSADWKAVQQDIDAQLPATINLISLNARADSRQLIVTAYSDRQPSIFLLYNKQTRQLQKIGDARPAIDARHMAQTDLMTYRARDGMEIPVWLTLPKGGGRKLPMVLFVRGAPGGSGSLWQWKSERQFLASRGYAVLQVEFRGSGRRGDQYLRAGWKQWGLAMQDDLADGARWAIAQGIADPQRICIIGGGAYGGYAALMGLIKDGDLFRCGVSWGGITDLPKMFTQHWSVDHRMGEEARQYTMPQRIGDPVRDAALLKANSPMYQAEKLTQPLLLAYGGADSKVPVYQGTQLRDKLKQNNPRVDWQLYADEGDRWGLAATRVDFWQRVEQFLDRNIGKGSAPAKKE